MRLLLSILLLLCMVCARAQEAVKNSSFQDIMNDFTALQERHTANQVTLTKLGSDLRDLPKAATPADFLKGALKLQKRIIDATADVQRENDNQVLFKNDLTLYSGNHKLLKQEQTYLSLYLDNLQKYGREQENAKRQLQQALQSINASIAKVPPPAEFTCSQGIVFVLYSPKGYITQTPLTKEQYRSIRHACSPELSEEELDRDQEHFVKEGLTLSEAKIVAASLGHLCGFNCALPNEEQLKSLGNYALTIKQALWLDNSTNKTSKDREALQRFGMTMARIWDPRACLAKTAGKDAVHNELPWMNYPELGLALVVDASAGKNAMLAEIELEIAEEMEETANDTMAADPAPQPEESQATDNTIQEEN
ncbi:MAG: DUF3450 domain-containing protein [Lentisphaeria bacterium]|nr:DUF3450 domain-containing protein [Lentisphaeria bacterium]